MIICLTILLFTNKIYGKPDDVREEFCRNLKCQETVEQKVCGIRYEGEAVTLKLFDNECQLLKYGCRVEKYKAYGITNIERCKSFFKKSINNNIESHITSCSDCPDDDDVVCGIRSEGRGFIVRTFANTCELTKHNCIYKTNFYLSDLFICINQNYADLETYDNKNGTENLTEVNLDDNTENIEENDTADHILDADDVKSDEIVFKNINDVNPIDFNIDENDTEDHILDEEEAKDKIEISENIEEDATESYILDGTTTSEDNDQIEITTPNIEDQQYQIVDETLQHEAINKDLVEDDKTTKSEHLTPSEHEDFNKNLDQDNKIDDRQEPEQNPEKLGRISPEMVYKENDTEKFRTNVNKTKGIIVVNAPLNYLHNINYSINNFFESTHVFDLPVKEIPAYKNKDLRRMMLKVFGPIKVFKPWISMPKNISEDYYHRPTLSTCFHRCPLECPDSYAPVCGVPGIVAREPSLMFQNHCYMDAAQCKMHWDDASDTAETSAYIESSFIFCLGDTMNGVFRFLPLVRTLQHMGRLKKKGKYRYQVRNLRFFNEMLLGAQPKFMG